MSEQLKPCPFCGKGTVSVFYNQNHFFFGHCSTCDSTGPKGATVEKAKELWNARSDL